MIVTDERVARFVSERLGFGLFPPYTAMGIERGGEIVAGVLFNCFDGPNVHVTVAGGGWTRGFLRAVGDYVFRQLGCARMTFTTEQEAVARLAGRLGALREGLMRDCFGAGRNGILLGVTVDGWRFH